MTEPKQTRRIAVIAVHGVADQKRYTTQQAAASLLSGLDGGVHYSKFDQTDILVPLNPIPLSKRLTTNEAQPTRSKLHQRGEIDHRGTDNTALQYDNSIGMSVDALDPPGLEHESVREQLQDFTPATDDRFYNTRVLSSIRTDAKNNTDKVDVYEAYWADLSRLGNGFLSAFFEFYLFLFLFPRIGGSSVERAAHFAKNPKSWRMLLKTHSLAEFTLSVAVPLTYLGLLSLLVTGVPYLLDYFGYLGYLPVLNGGLVFASLLGVGWILGQKLPAFLWWCVMPAVMVLVVALASIFPAWLSSTSVAVSLLWIWVSAGLLLVCKSYSKRRPGAFYCGVFVFIFTGITLLVFLLSSYGTIIIIGILSVVDDQILVRLNSILADGSIGRVFIVGVACFLIVALLNIAAWLVFVISTLINSLCGLYTVSTLDNGRNSDAARAIWTGALSLTLPGLLIMLISYSLWEVLFFGAKNIIPEAGTGLLRQMLDLNLFPHLPQMMMLLLFAITFAVWVLSPGPASDLGNHKHHEPSRLGDLLDRAFNKMRWSGEILRWLLIIALPLDWLYLILWQPAVGEQERFVALAIGICALLFFFGSKGPFTFLSMGFRSGLDVGLDVTNWLRLRPRRQNPRAAITRRFLSLVDYLSSWRDPYTAQGYDSIIIVAHSQGTVIAVDSFRFRTQEADIAKESLDANSVTALFSTLPPVQLLTFGSPLRQLYRQRFPHHYLWVNNPPATGPDPAGCGFGKWWNLYCSGDYIGRYLWRDAHDPNRWHNDWYQSDYPQARERCIGYGGHTRYWSGAYPEVGETLDELIASTTHTKNS